MPIEFENHLMTGPIDNPGDGLFQLKHPPVTGPKGEWRVLVDPVHGPSQGEGVDWGLTGTNFDYITYNLENSAIKKIRQHDIGVSGVGSEGPTIRVIYDYE